MQKTMGMVYQNISRFYPKLLNDHRLCNQTMKMQIPLKNIVKIQGEDLGNLTPKAMGNQSTASQPEWDFVGWSRNPELLRHRAHR